MPEKPAPTPAGLRHWFESHPPAARLRAWVAEEDGELVGSAAARLNWTVSPGDSSWVWAGVVERARGRGLGSELFERALGHARAIEARTLDTFALAGSPGERFAEARGFTRTRTVSILRLDVASVDLAEYERRAAAAARQGFLVASLAEVRDREDELYELYATASADIPEDDPEDAISEEDFRGHVLGDPELSPEGSAVVVEGCRPVALAFVLVDPEQGVGINEMTATLRDYRGRGLARLAKLATVRWARDNGLRELATEVDDRNVPMLAVNREVGYRRTHTRATLARPAEDE
jgi:GNAT superfamily N-acetyltransferase